MKSQIEEAVVIKRINIGEADRIVTLFTKDQGKISAIAKGVRKITSKKAPHIEPFTQVKIYLIETKSLPILTQAETINSFNNLKNNLETTRLTFHVGELIDKLLGENIPQEQIYQDLLTMLSYLDDIGKATLEKQKIAITRFQIRLLKELGFGAPDKQDDLSTIKYIESLLDQKLTAKDSLI